MQTLSFLNPALLWGLGLASIPIIIHLLYRRKFLRVDWAPMRYLKLTVQRNRRRIRLEQLLLLLVRTALILLLFLLVGRPLVHASGLGRWLGGDSRTSRIILLDDSLSMGLTSGGRSAFARAVELAQKLIDDVGPQDRFTLVLSSAPKAPLLRDVEPGSRDLGRELLRGLQPSETFTAWNPVLASVGELLQSSAYPIRELTIITDLRKAGWEERVAAGETWPQDQVRVRIFDAGSAVSRQVALERLTRLDRLALAGVPCRYEAVIRNGSETALDKLEAVLLVDGKPSQVSLPLLPPGESVTVPLSVTFQEFGLHSIALRLPDDDLPGDNARFDAVLVRESLHLMLVDGEPSGEPFRGEVDFLALALSLGAGAGESTAFQVQVLTDAEWAAATDADPDLIVLANVAGINPEQSRRLRKLAAAGAGVMIFPGDQTDPDSYNQQLGPGGAGLLPALFETVLDEPVTGLLLEENSPSPLDALRQLNPAVLERIKINRRLQVRLPPAEVSAARVLARWNDASASPAVIELSVGRGRVILWTVAADRSWSDWPTEPSYVLAMRETVKSVARADTSPRELIAGQPLRRNVSGQRGVQGATIDLPGDSEPRPLLVEDEAATRAAADAKTEPSAAGSSSSPDASSPAASSPAASSPTKVLTWGDTRRAGLYRLHWQGAPNEPGTDLVAVNPDPRESALATISAEDLRTQWGSVPLEIVSAVASDDTTVGVRGQEIWRTLALGLLVMMSCEAGLATWVGRQR